LFIAVAWNPLISQQKLFLREIIHTHYFTIIFCADKKKIHFLKAFFLQPQVFQEYMTGRKII
jgi:superfamily II DNA or RNA helicase